MKKIITIALVLVVSISMVFAADALAWTVDTWDDSILGIVKVKGDEKMVALFNFSGYDKVAWINEDDGM